MVLKWYPGWESIRKLSVHGGGVSEGRREREGEGVK